MFPDEVMQQLGLASPTPTIPFEPPPLDSGGLPPGYAGVPAPGLQPDTQAAIGVPPPMPQGQELPELPPPPQSDYSLPSFAAQTQPEATAAPSPAPAPPTTTQAQPPKTQTSHPQTQRPTLPSPEQQFAQAEAKRADADALNAEAIADTTIAKLGVAGERVAAAEREGQRAQALEADRKRWEQEGAKTLAEKQAFLDSQSKAVNDYKVNRGQYWDKVGLGNQIGWFIAIALSEVGRAMQARGGMNVSGQSPVIAMLQQRQEQAIADQIDERDRLKARRADAQHDLDKYFGVLKDRRAVHAAKLAESQQMTAKEIELAIAKSQDPLIRAEGTKQIADLRNKAAENIDKSAQWAAGHDINKKQLAVSQQNAMTSRLQAAETARHNLATEENARLGRELEAAKLEKQGKTDEAKLLRERGFFGEAKLVEVDPKNVKPGDKVVKKDGKTYIATLGPITTKNGDQFVAKGTDTIVSEAQRKYESYDRLGTLIRRLLDERPEYESGILNSDKFQRMKQIQGAIRLETQQAKGLGAITGRDIEYSDAFAGTDDPARWRDSKAGLEQALKTLEMEMRSTLHSRGLDKDWQAPWAASPPAAEPGKVQTIEATLKAKPSKAYEDAATKAWLDAYKSSAAPTDSAKRAEASAAAAVAREESRAGKIDVDQRRGIGELKKLALAGGEEGEAALAALQSVATSQVDRTVGPRWGPSGMPLPTTKEFDTQAEAVRKLAAQTLREIEEAKKPKETTSSAGPVYDPAGYNPEDLIRRFHRIPEPTDPRTRSASTP